MILPVLTVTFGLLVALIGMVITFIINPPVYGFGWDAGVWGTTEEEAKKEKVEKGPHP